MCMMFYFQFLHNDHVDSIGIIEIEQEKKNHKWIRNSWNHNENRSQELRGIVYCMQFALLCIICISN